jgi:predicted amidohydrolase
MDENLLIFKQRPDFVILPEYYNVNPIRRDTPKNSSEAPGYLKYCKILSERLETVLIAGTTITVNAGQFYNTCIIYDHGHPVGSYHKINPTENERKHGITPGTDISLFEMGGIRISTLICADVLNSGNFARLRKLEPDITFIPTTSPLKPNEPLRDKFKRDNSIFVAGAWAAGSYLVKCCAVGQLWGGHMQGRSLVTSPWGIITRISPEEENRPRILTVILDIAELREFRRKQDLVRTHDDIDNSC